MEQLMVKRKKKTFKVIIKMKVNKITKFKI